MHMGEHEELIQIEAEQLSETLFGSAYFDLTLELRLSIRARAIDSLWPEHMRDCVAAA